MSQTKFDPHQEQLKAKDEMIDYYKEQIEDLEMDRDSLKRMNDDMQEVLDKIVEVCQKEIDDCSMFKRDRLWIIAYHSMANKILNIIKPQKEEQNEQS